MLDTTISLETAALIEALTAVPLGATATYADLSRAVGRDVTTLARSGLASARRIAAREHGAVFVPVRGLGLRRLPPEEAPEIGAAGRRKVRRAARNATRTMLRLAESSNGLPPEAQRKLAAEVAALGLIEHVSGDKPAAAIEAARAEGGPAVMTPAMTARLLADQLTGAPKTSQEP